MTRISQEPVKMIEVRSLRYDKQLPTYKFGVWEPHKFSAAVPRDHPSKLRAFLLKYPNIYDDPSVAKNIPKADLDLLGEFAERSGFFDISGQ